jgi:hypothetical protein
MVTLRKVGLALGLVCGLAVAARAGSSPVQVFGNWARGEMGTAHNTGGAHYIGCWTSSDASGPPLVYCEANDGVGNFNFCYTQNTNMASALQSIHSASEVEFAWGGDHACLWLTVSNFSLAPGRKS